MNKLPTNKEIERLWNEFAVPSNVRAHMKKVAEVAVKITKKFKEKGIDVNADLIEKACLLHDLVRVCDFQSFEPNKEHGRAEPATEEELAIWKKLKNKYEKIHHADAAFQELKNKYPELAKVISKHKYSLIGDKEYGPQTWEEKIANYADKRVAHDKIVSMDERNRDALERYKNHKLIKLKDDRHERLKELEKDIFRKLNIKPEDIK